MHLPGPSNLIDISMYFLLEEQTIQLIGLLLKCPVIGMDWDENSESVVKHRKQNISR